MDKVCFCLLQIASFLRMIHVQYNLYKWVVLGGKKNKILSTFARRNSKTEVPGSETRGI